MKTEYKNAQKTKRKIMLSYLTLLKLKGQNFTVKDLVEHSGLNRGTFYLHFKNMDEVFQMIKDKLVRGFKSFENDFRMFDIDRSPELILNKFNQIISEDLEFFSLIVTAGSKIGFMSLVENNILKLISNNFQIMKYIFSIDHFNIVSHYIVGGVLRIYYEWFNKKINCSLNELSEYSSRLIKDGLKGCIHYGS